MTTQFKPEHLKLWTRPDYYAGASWPDHYVFLGQNRDSDSVTRSNFVTALKHVGGESETVLVIHEGHWLCGWVEWIAIHKDDEAALRKADEAVEALADYPILDDDHHSELEYSEAAEFWAGLSVRERADYIKEYTDASIFAARREELPQDDTGALFDVLRG